MPSKVEVAISAINKSEQEFKKLQSDLKKTQTEGKKATTVWDRFGQAGKGAANDVSKAMQGASGNAGILGSVLSKLGPIGVGLGATIGGISAAVVSGTMSMAEWEKRLGRTEALLKSTGYAAGLTATELDNLARDRDLATLGDRNEIMDAINLMQTFKSVSGETFKESIILAQDMSAVTGQSLTSATTMLGKALEDPIAGLNSMRRVGVSFTETEQAVIKAMTDANDVAGAQAKIMEVLRGQFQGAAEGEAVGLLGALDTLSYEWRDLMEAMGNTSAATDGVNALVGVVRDLEYSVKSVSGKFTLEDQASQLQSSIDQQRRSLETLRDEGTALPILDSWIGKGAAMDAAQQKLNELENKLRRIKALQEGKDTRDMFVIKDQGAAAADSRASDYEVLAQAEAEKLAEAARKKAQKESESAAKKAAAEKERLEKAAVRKAETEAKAKEQRLAKYREQLDEARMGKEYVQRQKIEAEYQQMLADGIGIGEANVWKTKEFEKLNEKVKKNVSQWKDAFGEFGDDAELVFGNMGNSLENSLETGNNLLDQFLITLLKISMVQLGELSFGGSSKKSSNSNLFTSIGGWFSDIFHDGGVIGGAAPQRIMPSDLFKDAPRKHSGGALGPGERPFIGKDGELVLNAMQQKNVAEEIRGGSVAPTVIVQLIGQDGNIISQTKAAQPQFDGTAFVTKEAVAIRFMQATAENTAGLTTYLRNGGF